MVTPAQQRATNKYNQRVYETVSAKSLREERINDQIAIAAEKTGKSRMAYILDAIRERLERDGVTRESLDVDAGDV